MGEASIRQTPGVKGLGEGVSICQEGRIISVVLWARGMGTLQYARSNRHDAIGRIHWPLVDGLTKMMLSMTDINLLNIKSTLLVI